MAGMSTLIIDIRPGRTTLVEDVLYSTLGLVVIAALYSDGRAHILGLPDSFFTPWHAFMYGGLLAMIVWLAIMARRAAIRRGGRSLTVLPAGYGFSAIGAGLFVLGGVADMVWHIVFGIEVGLEALLSPSHLLLFISGGLLLSGPLLAHRREVASPGAGTDKRIPAMLALTAITGLAAFALSYLSAFTTHAPEQSMPRAPEGTDAHVLAESLASEGLASFIITSIVLVVPAVYALRARVWFPGALTALITAVAIMASALTGFQNPESMVAALISGAALDALVFVLRRRARERALELIIAAALPLVVWSSQLIAHATRYQLRWSEELIFGVVLVSALVSVGVILALGGGIGQGAPRGSLEPDETRSTRTTRGATK